MKKSTTPQQLESPGRNFRRAPSRERRDVSMRDAWGGPLMVTRAGPEEGFLAVTGHAEVALPFLSVRGSAASLAEMGVNRSG